MQMLDSCDQLRVQSRAFDKAFDRHAELIGAGQQDDSMGRFLVLDDIRNHVACGQADLPGLQQTITRDCENIGGCSTTNYRANRRLGIPE